jgi:hypothetical protein
VLPDQGLRDVYAEPIVHSLSRVASSVEDRSGYSRAKEADSSPIADAYEQISIQRKRVLVGDHSAIATMLVAHLNVVAGLAQHVGELGPSENHVWELLSCDSPR